MRTLDTLYKYTGGKLEPLVELPEWLQDAIIRDREVDDWQRALSDQGADITERYGEMNESVDVWRMDGHGWFVDWWDTDKLVMGIYIDNPIDFAIFQTSWICPMATKIMAADAYIRDREARDAELERAEASIH